MWLNKINKPLEGLVWHLHVIYVCILWIWCRKDSLYQEWTNKWKSWVYLPVLFDLGNSNHSQICYYIFNSFCKLWSEPKLCKTDKWMNENSFDLCCLRALRWGCHLGEETEAVQETVQSRMGVGGGHWLLSDIHVSTEVARQQDKQGLCVDQILSLSPISHLESPVWL